MTCCTFPRFSSVISAWMILCLLGVPIGAQEPENPFANDADATSDDPADAAEPGEGGDAAGGAAAEGTPPAEETDPIVLAIRDSNPRTAGELARAINILLDAKRFDVAKEYLTRLLEVVADEDQLLNLHEQYGQTWFLRIARTKELAPEGVDLARRAWEAAQRVARDPERITALIDQLAVPDTRGPAASQLIKGRSVAAGHLIVALGDPNRAGVHRAIQSVLLSLGKDATQPIMAALEAAPAELSMKLIEVLDASGDRTALPKLVELAYSPAVPESVQQVARRAIANNQGRMPSKNASQKFLSDRFLETFRDRAMSRGDAAVNTVIWQWNAETGQLASQEVTSDMAERLQALRIAKALVALFPESAEYERWQMAAQLEWQQALAGDEGLLQVVAAPETAASPEERETLNGVLAFCLEMKRHAGAVGAASQLGAIATEQQLHVAGGELSPLVVALYSTEPRVQFAAAMAIMRINPTRSFAGCNRFRETLAFMIGAARERRALVASPRLDEGTSWGGYLTGFGWEPEIVTTGREVLQRIDESPYYEFILVSDAIDDPPIKELIQVIRQTSGGGEMPIGVLCRDEVYERLKTELAEEPISVVVPRPFSLEAAEFVVGEVIALPGRRMPPPEVRMHYASVALDWMRATVSSPYESVYQLLQIEEDVAKLLYDSPLDVKAAEVLGAFGTRTAQRQLVDIASQPAFSVALRKAAAEAFAVALSQRGVMLTSGEILQQYERYNASATLDRETQTILGSILDALESPRGVQQASSN